MKYPKIVVLDDPKLKKLIEEKNDFILAGRGISEEIDLINAEQVKINQKLVDEENKVDIKDLKEKGDKIVKQIEFLAEDLNKVQQDVLKRINENTSQELRDQYDLLEKSKEEKSQSLSKIGHKVQKVKDKIIPIIHKLGKPHLEDEWEDFSSTRLNEDGKPIVEIYSKLEEWKTVQRTNK